MEGTNPPLAKAPRLLVIENDEDYRIVLRRVLEPLVRSRGWESLFLNKAADAEAIVRRTTIDLLVSDYNLDDGLGTIVTRAAQASGSGPHRVILTSDPQSVERAWRDEPDIADEIWEKPWDPSIVAGRISACMTAVERGERPARPATTS